MLFTLATDSTSWLRIGPLVGGDREAVCLVCMSALVLSLSHRELKHGVGVKCLSSCRCREPLPKNNSSSLDDSETDKVQQI